MKKKKAIRNYVLIGLFIVVTLFLTICSFPVPGTNYNFLGLANMHLGLDIGGGVRNTYKLEIADWYKGDKNTAYRKAVDRVQYLLDIDYADARVYLNNEDSMTIEVPDTAISGDYLLGFIEMKSQSGADAEAKITGKDIEKVEYMLSGTTHGVYIEFTDDGTENDGKSKFQALTKEVAGSSDKTMYIYMNKNYDKPFSQPQINEENTLGYTFISGSGITSKDSGQRYARLIEGTTYGINMTTEQSAIEINGIFGENTRLVIIITTVAIIVASIVLMFVLYRNLGLSSALSLIFALMCSVLISAMFDLQITFAGWVGFLFGYLLNFALHLYYLNVIKSEFAKGKKFTVSFASGYKRALFNILDILLITVGSLLLFLIIPSVSIKMFTFNALITIPATAFTSMLLNKILAVNYTAFNLKDYKKIRFIKEDTQDEITA